MDTPLMKELLRRILVQIDESDPFVRQAVLNHLSERREELAREIPPERVLHTLSHPRIIDTWVRVNVQSILFKAAMLRLEAEKERYEQAKREMLEKLPIYEPSFRPAGQFQMSVFRLEVLANDPDQDLDLAWEVIRYALQMSRLDPDDLGSFQHPFTADENLAPFFSDLAREFRNSDKSRESVPKIVEDQAFAKKLADLSEEIVARPIKFLAGLRRDAGEVVPRIIQESLKKPLGPNPSDGPPKSPEEPDPPVNH